jgi:hypothetical protein
MNVNPLNETELTEILKIAQSGETKLKEMSNYATMMAEKWRVKTHTPEENVPQNNATARSL